MAKETVVLEAEQWTQLLNILTTVNLPWTTTNPLIMAIGGQLQTQRQGMMQPGNSHELAAAAQRLE
jgi:hypothetical protein